ncbi:MAG TPA: IPT/TIG domain-containing protein [Dongiaceae bacterium]|nr:IPT/TIG domain-containing protein [Dongiaceae bacterium]
MRFCATGLSFACLLVLSIAVLAGCNNTLNPLCGSARPVPQIGSLSPNTVNYSDVQQGATLTVNGSQFVSTTEVVINTTTLAATVVNANQMKVNLSPDVITGPGQVPVMAKTPSGNSSDLGCSSGGTSSALTLTVN